MPNMQNQQQSQQQSIPLSEKDLSFVKDLMAWELLESKKAFQYAHQTQDDDCRKIMLQNAEQHQRNCEQIMSHLGQHVNQVLQATMNSVGASM